MFTRNPCGGEATFRLRARRWMRIGLALLGLVSLPAFAQLADLVVNQSDAPDPGAAGGIFTYTIRVDDNGPNNAIAVTLTDTIPPGSVFVSATPTQGTCGTPTLGVFTCSLGDIGFLNFATVTLQVRLPIAGVYTNTVSATSTTPDPNTSNNLNRTETTTAQIAADMALTAVPSAGPISTGQPYFYTLTATNNGPNALTGSDTATVAFSIPAGACVTSVPTGTGWACTPSGGYPRCSGSISCTLPGPLAAGPAAPSINVNAVANQGGAITGAFQVSSTLPDGDSSNNTATATVNVTGGASDVSITKTASPTTVALNGDVTYTLTPRFNGGIPPGTQPPGIITVTDTLGANLSFVSASGAGWACTPLGQVITCTRPGPYNGGNFTDMPLITLVATATATGTLDNTATISAPEPDPVPGNNTANAGVTSTNDANLQLSKFASLTPLVPNQAFTFTLRARNNGPLALSASSLMTVTDTLPAGISLTGAPTGSGWTCAPTSGFPLAGPVVVSCTSPGPLAVNSNAPDITLPVLATSVATITNNACVALSGTGPGDPTAGDNCGSSTVTSTSTQADLQVVSKTAAPDPVLAGQNLTYVISVRNNGPDPSTNVVVTDALQSLVNTGGFQSATPSQGSCTPSTVTDGTSQNLSCNLGTLANGATATVTVVVRPSIATTGSRTNTARIASLDVGDPNQANNSGSVTSAVTAVADIQALKSATPTPVQAGTPLTFVVTARNNGPSNAQTVVATDTMPINAVFVQLSGVTGGGSCTTPAVGATGGTVTCSWGSIVAGAQQTATYVVRPLTASAGSTIDNSVAMTTTTLESDSTNNSATTSTPVTPAQVDILVNKTDSVDPVALGLPTTYTVTTTNAGPSFANNVVLVDSFPTGSPSATFSYQGSLTISPPGIGTCTEPAIGATSGTITCTYPGLNNGQSAVITYTMRAETIASGVSGTSFNTATVSANEPETQPGNNTTTESTTSRRTADLAVVKTAPASAIPGTTFSYSIIVTNNGPNSSTGAIVTDTLPAGVVFQSASAGCANVSATVTCTLGTIATGGNVALTITVLVPSPYVGPASLVNSATAGTVNEVDPVSPNNIGTATTSVGGPVADLSLVKSAGASANPGGVANFTLSVTNHGPSQSTGARVTDTLPIGVTFVSASPGCVFASGTVTCTLGALANGASTSFTILVRVGSPYTGPRPISNSADVTAVNETDPQTSNNSGTASIQVIDVKPIPTLNGWLLLALALALPWYARRRFVRR